MFIRKFIDSDSWHLVQVILVNSIDVTRKPFKLDYAASWILSATPALDHNVVVYKRANGIPQA